MLCTNFVRIPEQQFAAKGGKHCLKKKNNRPPWSYNISVGNCLLLIHYVGAPTYLGIGTGHLIEKNLPYSLFSCAAMTLHYPPSQ